MLRNRSVRYAVWMLLVCTLPAMAADNGLLWKVEGKGARPSYLLGTIHSEDPQVLRVADAVKPQLDSAGSFTAEVDLNIANALSAAMSMMIQDGKDLPALIGQERYEKCLKFLADYGVPDMMARQLKPWAVMVQLSAPKPNTGQFLDRVLYERAVQLQKPVYGLETMDEQLKVFDKLTLGQQIALLDETLENFPKLNQQLQTLIQYYAKRDLHGLQNYSETLSKSTHKELVSTINQTLLLDRNKRMAERMQVRLKEGNAFIAIGALHLPGDAGVLQLLKQQGYRVTVVY